MGKKIVRIPKLDEEMQTKSKVIAVMNNKGGCGKTTTALALGMYYARTGNNILFVDNDPQSNLTQRLGLTDDVKKDERLANIFENPKNKFNFSVACEYPYLQRLPGSKEKVGKISLIPGSHKSETYATHMYEDGEKYRRDFLRKTGCNNVYDFFNQFVDNYRLYYNYIIIDTAPALEGNILNTLAVRTSDEIIYPVDGIEAALGIDHILSWMYGETSRLRPSPNGMFVMVKYQIDTKDVKDSSRDRYSRNAVFRAMKDVFQDFVCDTGVREKRSLRFGKKTLPGFGGKTDYTELCEEIATKINMPDRNNLFKFAEDNGKLSELNQRLAEVSKAVQKRKPKFKQVYYQ